MSDRDPRQTVRHRLARFRLEEEGPAEDRAWRVVAAAAGGRERAPARGRAGRNLVRLVLAIGLVAALVSPAGASVRHWVADRIEPTAAPHAAPVLAGLPGHASLLVDSPAGPWVVDPDGSKRLLGGWTEASWSPHGLFAVVTNGREVAAVTPQGDVRWAVGRPGTVGKARWNGPDGERIAYLDGDEVRVVDGDGTDDRRVAEAAAWVAPSWQPGPGHVVAYSTHRGDVVATDADTGREVFTTHVHFPVSSLQWVGHHLFVTDSAGVRELDRSGRVLWTWAAPPGTRVAAASAAPGGGRVAVVLRAGQTSRLVLVSRGHAARALFVGPGRFATPTWAPDGSWLLLPWKSADQWLFLRPGDGAARLHAVDGVAAQFAPGQRRAARFPAVSGWVHSP